EARELAKQRRGAADSCACRMRILVQELHDLLEAGIDPLRVLEPPALPAKLVLLAFAELDGVDLRHLPAVELLLAGAFPGVVAQAGELGARRLPAPPERGQLRPRLLAPGEAIQDDELTRGLLDALVHR